jgi:thiamine biosynthesis lipoprotein
MPADFFSSVTVVHPDSGFADCMSTALFNMSLEDGRALIEKAKAEGFGEIKAVWILKDGSVIS